MRNVVGLEAIIEKIRELRNFDFRNYKRGTLARRVERRIKERKCKSASAYLDLLARDPQELEALISSMLIKVTAFFRDDDIWRELGRRVLPDLLAARRPSQELRIWSAGCATGEEAFSLAITVAEALGPAFPAWNVKIFGTDLDETAIATARRGTYAAADLAGVSPNLLKRWFTPASGGFTVKQDIRRTVVFGVNNLVSDAPVSRLDLIVCRNVFIYLDAELQKRVVRRFHYALRRDGLLVMGKAELIPFAAKVFAPLDLGRRIYRKDSRNEPPMAPGDAALSQLDKADARSAPTMQDHILNRLMRDSLDAVPLPVIATARDGSITLWNSQAARLWDRAEAEVIGRNLVALDLPGLTGDVLFEKAALVRNGKSQREDAEATSIPAGRKAPVTMNVEIRPLHGPDRAPIGLVYVLHDVSNLRTLELDVRKADEELRGANDRLRASNEQLRGSNEDYETTNEELQSANEELQTTNEELQSTNEELETTNEELQSTAAELDAINRELASRTEELHLLSFHQRTIIRSLSAAVVVLDVHGRITHWNLAAERLLGLPEGEAIGQIVWSLRIPALRRQLVQRIRSVVGERRALRVENVAYELPAGARGRATVAAVPLIEDDLSRGAVIVVEDTTRSSALAEENHRLKGRTRSAPRSVTRSAPKSVTRRPTKSAPKRRKR